MAPRRQTVETRTWHRSEDNPSLPFPYCTSTHTRNISTLVSGQSAPFATCDCLHDAGAHTHTHTHTTGK